MTRQGIDISSFQHGSSVGNYTDGNLPIAYKETTDYLRQQSGGVDPFVFIKGTEGSNYANLAADGHTGFIDDFKGFAAEGAIPILFHFARFGVSAADQINWINAHKIDGAKVFIDVEEGGFDGQNIDTIAAIARQLVETFDGLYTNVSTSNALSSYGAPWGKPHWLADPSNVDPTSPRLFTQYGQGTIPGITGTVDLDRCDDEATFSALFPAAKPSQPSAAAMVTNAPTSTQINVEAFTTQLPTIWIGSSASAASVKIAQSLLTLRGFPLTVDGVFGHISFTEVKAFQAAVGITQDGIVGPATWLHLFVGITEIQAGSTDSTSVKIAQSLLSLGGFTTAVDGVFGPVTRAQVLAFQRARNLTADGIVGQETWAALSGA